MFFLVFSNGSTFFNRRRTQIKGERNYFEMVERIEKLQRYFRKQKYKNEKEIFIKEQDEIFDVLFIIDGLH